MYPKPIYETNRLSLYPMSRFFEAALERLHRSPAVMEKLGGIYSHEKSNEKIRENEEHWLRHGFGLWCCIEKETNEMIGRGGIRYQQLDSGRQILEVAYMFFDHVWSRGFATELTCYCVDVAMNRLGFDQLFGVVKPENRASQRVLEKSGMCLQQSDIVFRGEKNLLYGVCR
ncbi:MAG: GNAT family N-acetyltransferase [Verrucomicrobia bacterium]|nr:GNAT family N-acetyltransferase [Verrucomicrobiota bacterium]